MSKITTHSSTRVNGTVAHGEPQSATVPALLAAIDGLSDLRRHMRGGIDSDAQVWVQVGDRRLDVADVADVEMATTQADRRAAAQRILAGQ